MREIALSSKSISQNPAHQMFGLGSSAQADSLLVEWPGGQLTDLGIVPVIQQLVIDHPGL